MQTMIDNFINGNLATAKRQARRHGQQAIYLHLHNVCGWQAHRAAVTAAYLKGQATFQAACDAEWQADGDAAEDHDLPRPSDYHCRALDGCERWGEG